MLAGHPLATLDADAVVRVNQHKRSWQGAHRDGNQTVAGLPDGGFVAVWQSYHQDRSGWGVYAQRFDDDSRPVGGEFRVAQTTRYSQRAPAVDVSTDGTFVIAWQSNRQDSSGEGIYARRYSATGRALTNELLVSGTTRGNQLNPDIAALTDGSFAVVWNGRGYKDRRGVFVRVFNGQGQPTSDERRVNSTKRGIQRDPSIAATPDGGFWVTWAGSGPKDATGIYSRRFDATGRPSGTEVSVNEYTRRWQRRPVIDISTGGQVLIGWQSYRQDGSSWGTYAQLFEPDGTVSGGAFRLNDRSRGIQHRPDVAFLRDGTFVATWTGRGADDPYGVFVRQFDASGRATSRTQRLSERKTGWQARSSVAATTIGFVSMWTGRGKGDLRGAFARQYETSTVASVELAPIADQQIAEGQQLTIRPALDSTSAAVVSYAFAGEAPAGASINRETGVVSWTPSEAQGPGEFEFVIRATGAAGSDEETFTIVVSEQNVMPELTPIGDRSVDEGEELSFTARASDIDVPANSLTYRLASDAPSGTVIDATTGAFSWTPTEQQGPNEFEVRVIVNDGNGGSDSESFTVSVGEVNRSPVLSQISNTSITSGQTVEFVATATDPDRPRDALTFGLGTGAPAGAEIDPQTGAFSWNPTAQLAGSTVPITVIVTDDGTPTLSDTQTFEVEIAGECTFDEQLTGWVVTESGGSSDPGSVAANSECGAVITEGDSFVTTLQRTFIIPEDTANLSFTFENLAFDTTDGTFINDAFEAALVGPDNMSLVDTFTSGRDAFFNITEDSAAATGAQTTVDGSTVSVDVAGLAGQTATLILRLANNDADANTSVVITDVSGLGEQIEGGSIGAAGRSATLASSANIVGPFADSISTRQVLANRSVVPGSADQQDLVLAASIGGAEHQAGATVLVSGTAALAGSVVGGFVESVIVNGQPADVMDVGGAFFSQVPVRAGNNAITVEAVDSTGRTAELTLVVVGNTDETRVSIDRFSDVTGSFASLYGRTSFNEETDTLHVGLGTRNDGTFGVDAPLLVGVRQLSAPAVSTSDTTGYLPDGTPYWDFTEYVEGDQLAPGEATATPNISFYNPQRTQFDYELVLLAALNQAPFFTSLPTVVGALGTGYSYESATIDLDGDTVVYSLDISPEGMSIDSGTGTLAWDPHLGNHQVTIRADDRRGGVTTQSFTLVVSESPPNRPPVITSTPVTIATAGLSGYQYEVLAIDHDEDTLSYTIAGGPAGLVVDRNSGLISWQPTNAQVGNHTVSVQVADSNGGVATQTYVLCVHPDPTNHAPTIVSAPITRIGQGDGTSGNPPTGDTIPAELIVDGPGTRIAETISLRLPEDGGELGTADVIFVVDESGSMAGEQAWLGDIISTLDDSLVAAGLVGNRYGLVGYVNQGRMLPTDGEPWMSAAEFSTATDELRTNRGPNEDGYLGIDYAIQNYEFRDTAARNIVLVTDEERSIVDEGLTFASISEQLRVEEIVFSMVANAILEDSAGASAFGVTHDGTAYVEGEGSGFVESSGGVFVEPGPGRGDRENIGPDYVDLAWEVDGNTWDLNFLRDDEAAAAAFTNVFVDILAETIVRRIPINVVASSDAVDFVNQSGIQTDIGPGELATFDVEFDAVAEPFDLAFINANTNEILGSIPVTVGGLYQYGIQAVDPDNDPLSYELVSGPSGMSVDATSGILRWSPPSESASESVVVRVSDGRGGVDEQEFSIDVNPAGDGQIRGTVFEDTDGDGQKSGEPRIEDAVVYLDENANGYRDVGERFTTTANDGKYSFTGLFEGDYLVRHEVASGFRTSLGSVDSYAVTIEGADDRSNISFGVQPVGSATVSPAFVSNALMSATSGELYRYDVLVIDEDSAALDYRLQFAPEGMTVHPKFGTVVWIPREEQQGSHSVVLVVTDEAGNRDTQAFSVVVSLPNSRPQFTSTPAREVFAGQQYAYQLSAIDAENHPVEFRLKKGPEGMALVTTNITGVDGEVVGTAYSLEWLIPESVVGSDPQVQLIARDAHGGVDRQTFRLVVSDSVQNEQPAIVSAPNLVARFGLEWRYQVEVNDANGDSLTYQLRKSPGGMQIDDSGLVTWTPSGNDPGPHVVKVRVLDGQGLQHTQEFELRVVSSTQNTAPVITSIPRATGIAGETYAYDAVATDAEFDPLFWSLDIAPRGMAIDVATGAIRWEPDAQQFGAHTVVLAVTDEFQARTTQRFEVMVGCSNLAPAILSVPPTAALTSQAYLYPVRGFDFEGDSLTWQLTESPEGMVISERGVISWAPQDTGTQDVTIEVSDGANTATQTYSIVVEDGDALVDPNDPDKGTKSNRAPIITSTPGFGAQVGTLYQYQAAAIDLDGDEVSFSLGSGVPDDLQIDSEGLLTWTPNTSDVGEVVVSVIATDTNGAAATQTYLLDVSNNQSPEISSEPVKAATSGSLYRYTVRATDPDGDLLTYTLDRGPEGMSVDRYGRIRWQSDVADEGIERVTVTVTDPIGQSATQDWRINMHPDDAPPAVVINIITDQGTAAGSTRVNLGSVYNVQVLATDNVGVESITLFVDGTAVALDSTATITLSAEELGRVQLMAEAIDTAGLSSTVEATAFVVDPAVPNQPIPTDPSLPPNPGFDPTDTGVPIVNIDTPTPGTPASGLVPIIGTVDDPEDNLWYYRAFYAREDRVSLTDIDLSDPDWTIFEERTTEVINGELAVFDPSVLPNDAYTIAVAGFDVNGLGYVHTTQVYVEGNVQVGNFRLEFTDLSIPLAGIPIEVTRVYDTANADIEGDFGFGWQLGVQDARILEATAIGEGGGLNSGLDKFYPDVTKVYLTNPDGERIGFTYREELISASFFGAIWRPYFEADAGVYDTLTIDETQVARGGLVGALTQGINPEHYTLTTKEGVQYRYSDADGLRTITDLNGNVVTFTDDGISHSSGESIRFVRDVRGRIEHIIDPANQRISFGYDLAGDLRTVTNQADLTTRYHYRKDSPHFLNAAFDSSGNRTLRAVYSQDDKTGVRVFRGVIDAFGNRIDNRDFDLDRNTGVIRDGNGNQTSLTFDDRGNLLTESDPLGFVRTYKYEDPRNPDLETRIIEKDGHITDREYDERGNLLHNIELGKEADPFEEPIVTSYTYDSGNRVTSFTDARDYTTTFRYYDNGNLREIINAAEDSAFITYHAEGNVETFTDFRGYVTRYDDYQAGQPKLITYEDGVTERREFNQYGQVTFEAYIESDGRISQQRSLRYDELGRLIEEILGGEADGSTTIRQLVYDSDVLDWEIVVHPDSVAEDGTLLEGPDTPIDDRKSSITDYVYDAKQQLIQQIDAEGGIIDFRYDPQGNRIALRDPVGNLTTWLYDGMNQPVEERDPLYWDDVRRSDELFTSMTDDEFLNLVAPLDPSEVEDPLYDDPSGTDADTNIGADHVIFSVYDPVGNLDKKIDRNGRRTEYDHDFLQNLTEERWYDTDGDLVRALVYTYDEVGNMRTAVDPDSSLTFTYDELNRQRTADNAGTPNVPRVLLTYGYDANGNVTSVVDSDGVSVVSVYDSRNLLESRAWLDATPGEEADVDPLSIKFEHNAAGRVSEMFRYSDANFMTLVGLVHRGYDLASRPDEISFNDAVGDVLSAYSFDYNELGRMDEDSRGGISSVYDYDLTGQLTAATRSNGGRELFSYDMNGNRTLPDYVIQNGNRLQSDGEYDYAYDGEGNRIRRTHRETGVITQYEFDHRNRLTHVSEDRSTEMRDVEYVYDVENRRLSITTPERTTLSVFDRQHVWFDTNHSGEVTHRLLHHDEVDIQLASYARSQASTFTNTDHLGSVVGYVSSEGVLLGSLDYSAFGEVRSGMLRGRFGFTGREFDDSTDTYYYRSRFYDASAGRFLSEDQIRFAALDANLYRYARNTPTTLRDPSGEASIAAYTLLFSVVIQVWGCQLPPQYGFPCIIGAIELFSPLVTSSHIVVDTLQQ